MLNIGLLHTALAGTEGHANYAPCSLEQLVQKGYDYWALGHVHQPDIRHERPFVVYSGVVQGRHIRETGPKGAVLVSVEEGAIAEVVPFQVDLVRWAIVEVDAGRCRSIRDLSDTIRDGIEQAVDERADGRLLACRVAVTGRTEIHAAIPASEELLLAEARSAAEGLGEERAWIERLSIRTQAMPDAGLETDLSELLGGIGEAREDEDLHAELRDDIGAFVAKLPHDIRDQSDDPLLSAAEAKEYGRLADLAEPYATARLQGGNLR